MHRRAVLLSALLLFVLLAGVAQAPAFPVTSETVVVGSTNGISGAQTEDDIFESMTEADTASDPITYPGTETITDGLDCGGTFPTDIQSSNDVRICRDEELTNTTDLNVNPDAQTIVLATQTGGTFPTCVQANDNVYCIYDEGIASSPNEDNFPSTQTIVTGTQTGGTFSSCVTSSDNTYCTYQEAGASTDISPDTQTLNLGTQTGGTFAGCLQTDDNVYCVYQEAVAGTLNQDYFPGFETIVIGSRTSGTFPTCIQTSDNTYCTYAEAGTISTFDVFPDTQTLTLGTQTTGTFPTCLTADDNSFCSWQEGVAGSSVQDYTAGSQTIVKGTQTGGTFPGCAATSEDTRCIYQEADQAGAPTILNVDTQNVIKGTQPSGTFPTDVNSDNGVSITYREANQAITGTIAFDAAAESERTGTTDPHTWTHTPVGTPRAIVVMTSHGVTATHHVLSCTYGGVSMTLVTSATDTANEPGAVRLFFLGASIPTAAQTVSCDLDSATADDIHFVSMSFTATSDTEVVTSDVDQENQANPSTTLAFGGRRSISTMIFYSGAISPPGTTACSGSSACTLSHTMDQGAFGDSTAYQTTAGTTDEVMGWTQASDDVAVAYAAISEIATAPDYELEVQYDWTTETCTGTRRLTVNGWHTTTEDILVQVYDAAESNPTTRITITATADGTTYTYDLSAAAPDEWDSGNPTIRFLGNTESGDSTQTDLLLDYVVIQCILAADYEVEVKYDWTGVSTTGTEWRLFVEGREGVTNPETISVKICTSGESCVPETTVCSISSTTESTYNCGTLSADQRDGGNPSIYFIDSNQAESSQSTFEIDQVYIRRTFNFYGLTIQHDWTATVAPADSYLLRLRSCDIPSPCGQAIVEPESFPVQVWDWGASLWNTRLTINGQTETQYDYALNVAGCPVSVCEVNGLGNVRIRYIGSDETATDEGQSSVTTDLELVRRTVTTDYQIEILYDWTGISTSGNSWTLIEECKRVGNPEDALIQVASWPGPTWNTRYVCNQNADTTYSSYALTTNELNGGSPSVRVLYNATLDASQSTWDLDYVAIRRNYNVYDANVVHDWTATVGAADTYTFRIQAFRSDTENWVVEFWDFQDLNWNPTAITISSGTETLYTEALVATCGGGADDCERDSSGNVKVRFTTASATDETQSTMSIDIEVVRRFGDYQIEILYDWTGISTSGNSWTLWVECKRVTNPESALIQVANWPGPTWTTAYTCDQNVDTTYSTFTLNTNQLNGGAPRVRTLYEATLDQSQSTWDLDYVKVVRNYNLYQMEVQYDWTDTIPLVDILQLNVRAFRTGDSENPAVDVWDWEDLDWNLNRIAISSGTETLYTYTLSSACGAGADNCERSSTDDVRIRFRESTNDETVTTLSLDEVWIDVIDQNYKLDVRYDWTGVPACDICRLTVEAQRTNDTETINVDVLTPPATWNTRLTITTATDFTQTYDLSGPEYNSGNPAIRYRDAGGVGGSATRVQTDLLQIQSIVTSFALDVRHIVSGITGDNPVLDVKGRLAAAGENFDISVWDFTGSSWTLWQDSTFTTTNTKVTRTLLATEISGGEVRVRFTDDTPTDDAASVLQIDLTLVTTSGDGEVRPGRSTTWRTVALHPTAVADFPIGNAVQFRVNAFGNDTTVEPIVFWDFGDGTWAMGLNPKHAYPMPKLARVYEVRVVLCDRTSVPSQSMFFNYFGEFDPQERMFTAGICKAERFSVVVYSPVLLLLLLMVPAALFVTTRGIVYADRKRQRMEARS